MMAGLVVALCKRTAPICPKCGRMLNVLVEAGNTVRGRCQRTVCRQHYAVVGFGERTVLVVALSPDEFHAALRGQPLEVERARIAFSAPEPAA